MRIEGLFEMATRKKLRFPWRGSISVEDLWDLHRADLDQVYRKINSDVKKETEEGLLNSEGKNVEIMKVQLEIIKHIASVKRAEKEERMREEELAREKQKIMQVISDKRMEELKEMSIDELNALLKK